MTLGCLYSEVTIKPRPENKSVSDEQTVTADLCFRKIVLTAARKAD